VRGSEGFDQDSARVGGHGAGMGHRIVCALDNLALAIGLMAACRSTTDWKTPRLRRRLARAEVGVKWKVQRGWRASHFRTSGCFVDGIVVEDRMDGLAGGDLALDGVEETDELLSSCFCPSLSSSEGLQRVEGDIRSIAPEGPLWGEAV
jgi:hypothetical protein